MLLKKHAGIQKIICVCLKDELRFSGGGGRTNNESHSRHMNISDVMYYFFNNTINIAIKTTNIVTSIT
jgi:hypothetical protein